MPSPNVELMMTDTSFNPHQSKKYPNRRQAAGMSAIGGGLSYIPILGKVLGAPFMIPDLLYDAYDLYKERGDLKRTLANVGHFVLDFPSWIPGVKGDDALEIGGVVDDGIYFLTGKQVEEHVKDAYNANEAVRKIRRRSLEDAQIYQNNK